MVSCCSVAGGHRLGGSNMKVDTFGYQFVFGRGGVMEVHFLGLEGDISEQNT